MRTIDIIDGLLVLQNYYTNPDGYHSGAEHDEFHAYPTDRPLSEIDVVRMRELGWFQTEGGAENTDDYDPEDGWMCFT